MYLRESYAKNGALLNVGFTFITTSEVNPQISVRYRVSFAFVGGKVEIQGSRTFPQVTQLINTELMGSD
jgi:hypothetical protein